jgi:lia operon protein LiaF
MKRWQIIIGITLVVLGIFSLLNQFFPGLKIGRFFMPLLLIGLGTLLVLRPRIAGPDVIVQFPILGDLRRTGTWEVTQHEIWWFVGSSRFDFSEAIFPNKDALVKIIAFVADTKIILPEDVGLSVESYAFVNEYHGLKGKQERFLSPVEEQTPNYLTADKRVKVQVYSFVSELKVRPSL